MHAAANLYEISGQRTRLGWTVLPVLRVGTKQDNRDLG
jgi:hypothetical protein